MKPEKAARLHALIAIIEDRLLRSVAPGDITDELIEAHEARFGFTGGTYHMTLAGVRGSCTAGGACVFKSWLRAARKALRDAPAPAPVVAVEQRQDGRFNPLAALVLIACTGATVGFWAWVAGQVLA